MFKTLMAAAALATMAVPSVADAAKYGEKIRLLKQIKSQKSDKLDKLKLQWKAGKLNLTRDEYLAKLAKIQASLDRIASHLQKLRDKKASA